MTIIVVNKVDHMKRPLWGFPTIVEGVGLFYLIVSGTSLATSNQLVGLNLACKPDFGPASNPDTPQSS